MCVPPLRLLLDPVSLARLPLVMAIVMAIAAMACQETPATSPCGVCAPKTVCHDGTCRLLCNSNSDCPPGDECMNGKCLPRQSNGDPGSGDPLSGDGDPASGDPGDPTLGDTAPGDPGDPAWGDSAAGDSQWGQPGLGPFVGSVIPGPGVTITVEGEFELGFDPADGGTIDTWYDLALDPSRFTNLATGQAQSQYDGLFFQRTQIEGGWRPQGSDTGATVELLSFNGVRFVVHVAALLDAPTLDFDVLQRYVVHRPGAAWIEATYAAVDAATPDEINYSLAVANSTLTGLTWTHATSNDEPLPHRVQTPAPEFIFHFASMNGGTVFTGLFPIPLLPAGSEIFGVYNLNNTEFIYYHEDDRPFAAGESLPRNLLLLLKTFGTAPAAAELEAFADQLASPPTLDITAGSPWPGIDFAAADGASHVLGTAGGAAFTLEIGGVERALPAFRIGGWPTAAAPSAVSLDGVPQFALRDYAVAVERVARAWIRSASVTQIADAGLIGVSANEQLADANVATPLVFVDSATELLLGFASPVTGFHVSADPRVPVSSPVLAWEVQTSTGWSPLPVSATPSDAANLWVSGHVRFTPPGNWALAAGSNGEVPLYYVRARRQTAVPFDPPVSLRTLTSDVLDLQLFRFVDRDVTVSLTP